MAWLLRHVLGVEAVVCYLDDFLLISIDESASKHATAIAKLLFDLLGVPMQMDKLEEDTDNVVFLGVHMFFREEKLKLPARRVSNLLSRIKEWQQKQTATSKDISKLCGSLAYASRVIGCGRLFINRMYKKIHYGQHKERETRNQFFQVELGGAQGEFQKDLNWWATLLLWYNEASPMIDLSLILIPAIDVYTDASN